MLSFCGACLSWYMSCHDLVYIYCGLLYVDHGLYGCVWWLNLSKMIEGHELLCVCVCMHAQESACLCVSMWWPEYICWDRRLKAIGPSPLALQRLSTPHLQS